MAMCVYVNHKLTIVPMAGYEIVNGELFKKKPKKRIIRSTDFDLEEPDSYSPPRVSEHMPKYTGAYQGC